MARRVPKATVEQKHTLTEPVLHRCRRYSGCVKQCLVLGFMSLPLRTRLLWFLAMFEAITVAVHAAQVS